MPTQYISRRATLQPSALGKANAAPIRVDSDDNKIKIVVDGSASTTEVEIPNVSTLSAGSGISSAETYKTSVTEEGGLIVTKIVVDLTGLVGSATDLDIIGNSGAASANFGQITTAINGTPVAGRVTCLEVPAGGADDIDLYSSTVGTGTQDVIITDAALGTETALVTSGAAWASGTTKGMTSLPTANDYLYFVNGEAVGGTFTAGKFLIELFGAA